MSKFSPTAAIGFGWETFKKNITFLLGLTAILLVIQFLFSIFTSALFPKQNVNLSSTNVSLYGGSLFTSTFVTLLSAAVSFIISLGIIKAIINLVDSGKGNFSDILLPFKEPKIFINYLLAGLVIGAAWAILAIPFFLVSVLTLGIGFLIGLALIIWVGIRIGFFSYFIIDKGSGPIESMKQSWAATKGNVMNLILFYFLSVLVVCLGFIALIVGIVVAIPVVMVAQAWVYRRLSEGGVAAAPVPTQEAVATPPATG